MFHRHHHIAPVIAFALFAGLALGPSAAAALGPQSPDARDANAAAQRQRSSVADPQSPDARDANAAAQRQRSSVSVADPQSPDARDANAAAKRQRSSVSVADPRSPDARDAARGVGVGGFPISAPTESSRGFDWGDAGIGAAGMLVVALLGLGAVVAVQHRRRTPAAPLAH
jgi:hypothetical protein